MVGCNGDEIKGILSFIGKIIWYKNGIKYFWEDIEKEKVLFVNVFIVDSG